MPAGSSTYTFFPRRRLGSLLLALPHYALAAAAPWQAKIPCWRAWTSGNCRLGLSPPIYQLVLCARRGGGLCSQLILAWTPSVFSMQPGPAERQRRKPNWYAKPQNGRWVLLWRPAETKPPRGKYGERRWPLGWHSDGEPLKSPRFASSPGAQTGGDFSRACPQRGGADANITVLMSR